MSFSKRINNVKETFHNNSLTGIYITNLTNVRYLTGFTGSAGSLLILENQNHFFTDGRYIEQSKSQVKNSIIHIVGGLHPKAIQEKELIAKKQQIGFESEHVSVNLYTTLRELMPNVKWEKTSGIVEEIAAVKDLFEIDSFKTAIEITNDGFKKII